MHQGHQVIPIADVYDKDINFLFGSGASAGLLPTLRLGLQKGDGSRWSLEELATHLDAETDPRYWPLFMHYYNTCVRPAQILDLDAATSSPRGPEVVANYRTFIQTVLTILQRRKPLDRRCNIFTTNYDGCIPLVADQIHCEGKVDFVINDGTRGFRKKFLQAHNFNNYLCQTGVFDRHQNSVPQLNLIYLHGSVYWSKVGAAIQVNYGSDPNTSLLSDGSIVKLQAFSETLLNEDACLGDLPMPDFTSGELSAFKAEYEKIPIVNPTKWKFHETVYEEHYYQMLRLLSYELEKPNAVLITYGFSFADEHILNLVKRSLSNPHLQVFICCYDGATHSTLAAQFQGYRNVKCLVLDNSRKMDFTSFNSDVFTLRDPSTPNAGATSTTGSLASIAPMEPALGDEV